MTNYHKFTSYLMIKSCKFFSKSQEYDYAITDKKSKHEDTTLPLKLYPII